MQHTCRTCRFWIYRLQTVAGVRGHYPGCAKWSGYFPDSGRFCPVYEREPGADDE